MIFNFASLEVFAGIKSCENLLTPRYTHEGETLQLRGKELLMENINGSVIQKNINDAKKLIKVLKEMDNSTPQGKKSLDHAEKLIRSLTHFKDATTKYSERMQKVAIAQMDDERLSAFRGVANRYEELMKSIYDNTNNVIMLGGSTHFRKRLLKDLSLTSRNNSKKHGKRAFKSDKESRSMREKIVDALGPKNSETLFQDPNEFDYSEHDMAINFINMGQGEIGYRFKEIEPLSMSNIEDALTAKEVKDADIAILLVDNEYEFEVQYLKELLKKRKLQIFLVASRGSKEMIGKMALENSLNDQFKDAFLGSWVYEKSKGFDLMDTIFNHADFSGNLKISRIRDDYATLLKDYQEFILDLAIREKSLKYVQMYYNVKTSELMDNFNDPFFSENTIKDVIDISAHIYKKVEGNKTKFFHDKEIVKLRARIEELHEEQMMYHTKSEESVNLLTDEYKDDLKNNQAIKKIAADDAPLIAQNILKDLDGNISELEIESSEIAERIENEIARYHTEWVKFHLEGEVSSLLLGLENDLMALEEEYIESMQSLNLLFTELSKMKENDPKVKEAIGISKYIAGTLSTVFAITSISSLVLLTGDTTHFSNTELYKSILSSDFGNFLTEQGFFENKIGFIFYSSALLGLSLTLGAYVALITPFLNKRVRTKLYEILKKIYSGSFASKGQELSDENLESLKIDFTSLTKAELKVMKNELKVISKILKQKRSLLKSVKTKDLKKLKELEIYKQQSMQRVIRSWVHNANNK